MVTTHLRSILVLLLLLLAKPAFSQVDCGTNPKDVPADVQQTLSGDVEGKAHLFTKLLGDANLKGTVQTSKNEIYQKYNNIDKSQIDRYMEWVSCQTILNDKSIDSSAKIKLWISVYRELNGPPGPVTVNTPPPPPPCAPGVLKTISIPQMPTFDGNHFVVGTISGAVVSIIRECPSPNTSKDKVSFSYGYYNGSGTWRGEEHMVLVLKSAQGGPLFSQTYGIDRSRCWYGKPQTFVVEADLVVQIKQMIPVLSSSSPRAQKRGSMTAGLVTAALFHTNERRGVVGIKC